MHEFSFKPPAYLANAHLQTVLASSGPRQIKLLPTLRRLQQISTPLLLESSAGARLLGYYTAAPAESRGLALLLHGWEGSSDSAYVVSTAIRLHQAGYSVFRLNFRDHGPTHHLNHDLFNSTRLDEVGEALSQVTQRYPHEQCMAIGFSLGGNFALRLGCRIRHYGLGIHDIVAVCPVISPRHTMQHLEAGPAVYHQYFLRRWKRSLQQKLRLFPDLGYGHLLAQANSLQAMNAFFVPGYTDYADPDQYLDAYAISGNRLGALEVPSRIIASADDPIIDSEHLRWIQPSSQLQIECHDFGGHCGFLMNWKLDGWLEQRILQLLEHPSWIRD